MSYATSCSTLDPALRMEAAGANLSADALLAALAAAYLLARPGVLQASVLYSPAVATAGLEPLPLVPQSVCVVRSCAVTRTVKTERQRQGMGRPADEVMI